METGVLGVELRMLAWAVVLGLVHVFLYVSMATRDKGLRWNMGARDEAGAPARPATERAGRAQRNFLETFPFFAAVVLAVVVAGRTDASTALGAQLYLWARVAYLPVYVAGIPYVRTAVWGVSLVGLLMVLRALL